MKAKTVKLKIKRLVELCGSGSNGRKSTAERLGVALSYIYQLEKGRKKPGKHLYDAIVRLCDELEAENVPKD